MSEEAGEGEPGKVLSGAERLARAHEACAESKATYDACFKAWYDAKFSVGVFGTNPCSPQWDDFQRCFVPHMTPPRRRAAP